MSITALVLNVFSHWNTSDGHIYMRCTNSKDIYDVDITPENVKSFLSVFRVLDEKTITRTDIQLDLKKQEIYPVGAKNKRGVPATIERED